VTYQKKKRHVIKIRGLEIRLACGGALALCDSEKWFSVILITTKAAVIILICMDAVQQLNFYLVTESEG
jgi:hypothetical protein